MPNKAGKPEREAEGKVKTTVELPESLWQQAKIRAVQERSDLRGIIIAALEVYLKRKE